MKRLLCLIFAAVILIPAAAAQGWYCGKATENSRPACPCDENLLKENNAAYIGPDEKRVYLTFDAGYENGNVEKIRRVLKARGVNGAFFVLKHFITANPELVENLALDGNLICNHTLSHRDPAKLGEN